MLIAMSLWWVVVPITLVFAAIWVGMSAVMAGMAGWAGFVRAFPNRTEAAILTLRGQSGSFGAAVNFNGILNLSACPSGLRVGVFWLFALFSQDFLVPWDAPP